MLTVVCCCLLVAAICVAVDISATDDERRRDISERAIKPASTSATSRIAAASPNSCQVLARTSVAASFS